MGFETSTKNLAERYLLNHNGRHSSSSLSPTLSTHGVADRLKPGITPRKIGGDRKPRAGCVEQSEWVYLGRFRFEARRSEKSVKPPTSHPLVAPLHPSLGDTPPNCVPFQPHQFDSKTLLLLPVRLHSEQCAYRIAHAELTPSAAPSSLAEQKDAVLFYIQLSTPHPCLRRPMQGTNRK